MSDKYHVFGSGVAAVSGANDESIINLFNPVATPTHRGNIYELIVGSSGAAPADNVARFTLGRTTGVGTESAGFTPVALDSGAPAGEYDSGVGFTGGEPTYTANKELLQFPLNSRATFRWVCAPNSEFKLPATQNNGAGLRTRYSSSTQAHDATIFFEE